MSIPVPVYVPGNGQTAWDHRLKAGPSAKSSPPGEQVPGLLPCLNKIENCKFVCTHRGFYEKGNVIQWDMKINGAIKKLISCVILVVLTGSLAGACSVAAETAGDALPENPGDACWYCIDTCVANHPPFSDLFGYIFCIFGCNFSCPSPDPVPW